MQKRLVAATLVASLMTTGGCSFVFVDGPPKDHATRPTFDCSTSNVVPVLDGLFGALELANFVYTATRTQQDWDDIYKHDAPFSRHEGLALYGVLTAISAAAATYGFVRVHRCVEAKHELIQRMGTQQPAAPGGWLPPAPPAGPPVPPMDTTPPPRETTPTPAPTPDPSQPPPGTDPVPPPDAAPAPTPQDPAP